jgi:hypothetical protein
MLFDKVLEGIRKLNISPELKYLQLSKWQAILKEFCHRETGRPYRIVCTGTQYLTVRCDSVITGNPYLISPTVNHGTPSGRN